ncbi:hypothetical protein D7Y13_36015 [Corallococcus praedator]|uniref:Uncharacterized protein n=2 Tax=Myxococcaceae TaxID=31 RepID=A0ABX9Q7B6_9BACT|nr:hypothetical protein D7X74_17175 [Corallococcus sp. CA047B]RKH25068.1 hypothetical protein D7X75_30775 [Corallococcus sp. CA031C]RKH92621.1 hypothetical protein D7Y13_36015 [Corallococcus praedator]
MPRKMKEAFADPSLHDPHWRAFILDMENTSARRDWRRFRADLRRLERRHTGRVPTAPMHRALAEDVFLCAAHWEQTPRIVRGALRELLRYPLRFALYSFVAAEYWRWASKVSPADLLAAEAMLAEVREALPSLDEHERWNTEGLLASLKR